MSASALVTSETLALSSGTQLKKHSSGLMILPGSLPPTMGKTEQKNSTAGVESLQQRLFTSW